MTENEYLNLQSAIAMGEELNFYYNNDEYWISNNPGEHYLTRSRGQYTQVYASCEELFEKGTIEGIKLSEIYSKLRWQPEARTK